MRTRSLITLFTGFIAVASLHAADVAPKPKEKPKRPAGVGPAIGENKATPISRIKVAKDFKVELLYSVPGETQGSWVNLCADDKGRIYASDQYGGLYRFNAPAPGQPLDPKDVQKLPVEIRAVNGMVFAFGALYVGVNDYEGIIPCGLYRITSSKGDGELHLVELAVTLARRDAIEAARDDALVVVYADVERAKCEDHPVHRTDVHGQLLHVLRIERLARRGGVETIQPAVLITRVDAPLVVRAEIHPRALRLAGHRVEQLHFEILRDLDALDRRRLVLADGGADGGGALRFFLRLRRVGGVRDGDGKSEREDREREFLAGRGHGDGVGLKRW